MKQYKIWVWMALLFLAPAGLYGLTSTSYQIEPTGDTTSIGHTGSSASFQLNGEIKPIVGDMSSASYSISNSPVFAGFCGDGVVDPSEDCDGLNLNSQTCSTLGASGGTLSCASNCTFNQSACTSGGSGGGGGGGGGGSSSGGGSGSGSSGSGSSGSGNTTSPGSGAGGNYGPASFDPSFTSGDYTYKSLKKFFGIKSPATDRVVINGSDQGFVFPTDSRWNKVIALAFGNNILRLEGYEGSAQNSARTLEITRYLPGDANHDGYVNDYDLSLTVSNWGARWRPADFNEDALVNDYDLSLMISFWEQFIEIKK